MEPDQILDKDFNQQIRDYLLGKEELVWQGKPEPGFTITLLELGGYYDVMTGPSSILGFILGGMGIGGIIFYTQSNWTGFALTMLAGLLAIFSPDILKYIRRRNTRYAFTQHRVFFQLWWWGRSRISVIDLADIVRISWQEYDDKGGVIHFMTTKDPGFYTYDFQTGRRRDYPSFEMVPNAVELTEKLERLRIERISSKQAGDH